MSETIRKMIALGESENLEFKASFGKEVIESLAAFANHKGGVVLVGVEDSGNVVGVKCGPESIQAWVNQVKQSTMPSNYSRCRTCHVGQQAGGCYSRR